MGLCLYLTYASFTFMQIHFITLLLVLLTSSALSSTTSRISLVSTTIFDVVQYGAKGDGIIDDSPAFIAAWKAACQSTPNTTSILNIPVGRTYLLKPIAFTGPCKPSKIFVQVYISRRPIWS
ncbi:putative endo-polygalacturonase [Helianthus annuus]|nr:putative endo-polygalacturonase [Helianthus annuus]KAJ0884403.1 putative polygalacturonase [Helianthus annuus]